MTYTVLRTVPDPDDDIRAWIETWNENPYPFIWTKAADEIGNSLATFLTRLSG